MDIITLSNQTKFANALKHNRIALYPRSMIPKDVIPLDGQCIDITNISLLNNLPIHHLVKPRYCGLARDFADAANYVGTVSAIVELPMNNQFLYVGDTGNCAIISPDAAGDPWIVDQNPGFIIGSNTLWSVASTVSHTVANTQMTWVSNKLTNTILIAANQQSGQSAQGSINPNQVWVTIPSISDILSPLFNPAIYVGGTLLVGTNDLSKIFIIPNEMDSSGNKVVLVIPNNSTVATRIQNVVPLDNTESVPLIINSNNKDGYQYLNVLDCKTGAFRIPTGKEPILRGGTVINQSADRVFCSNSIGADTLLYELVDIVNGQEIINPIVYRNPKLIIRATFPRKNFYVSHIDATANAIYGNIVNQNTTEPGSATHQNVNTLISIDMNTYSMEKIMETPVLTRCVKLSRDRSTLIIGLQRGYYIYNINRKQYKLPKLTAPRGMVYGLTP